MPTAVFDVDLVGRWEDIFVSPEYDPAEVLLELCARYPVRYVIEPRKGLNWRWAHSARAANNEILLYTDDDVVVDPGWIGAMCAPFEDESVGAAADIIMPLELESALRLNPTAAEADAIRAVLVSH